MKDCLDNAFNKNKVDLLNECGILRNNFDGLCLDFEEEVMEQIEENLDFIENEERSNIESFPNK